MIEQEDIFFALLAVLVITVLYLYWLPEHTDTHEMILQNQASISKMRQQGETAVYRSLVAPHGRSLMTGLAIGHNYTTRPGNVSDIWKIGSNASKVLTVHSKTLSLSVDSLPNGKSV